MTLEEPLSNSTSRERITGTGNLSRSMTSPAPNDVLRVLVADDEPAARDKLVRLLGAYSDVVVAGTASNGPEAVRSIRELAPDVVLLDIRMPELDGLEVVDEVSRDGSLRTHIVFVTAY